MAVIQWFPGHMAKAKREVQEKLKYVDIVFELVDARLPLSSRNPLMDKIVGEKKRLVLLNKVDLADPAKIKSWIAYFERQGHKALAINSKENSASKQIISAAKVELKEKFDRERSRGIKPRAIRAMTIGIPNVGKSTLMNRLIGKKIANVGNKPGVTKGQQWLRHNSELELLDTPGILWPKFEDPEIAKKLALTGAIKDQLIPIDDIAIYAIDFFKTHYPEYLRNLYKIDNFEEDSAEILLELTRKRGMRDDYDRMAEVILNDVRSGRLGRYILDEVPVDED
ncbi:MAG: ribosome biogenesis GTPase YlqF [Lactobacillales bacterium]|jgi:ribosome biogenesis GTPase A|nr:ribosome biogenesis GTPase YlqF [Lactobacillales bacterium]